MMAEWSLRFLENAVQEILELILAGLLVPLCFHWSQDNIDVVVHLLELTWADCCAWNLLVMHRWHNSADLALKSAVAISD